jgi:predicted DsbA family dithiol-disulfide isomerase
VLAGIAEQVSLDPAALRAALTDGRYRDQVTQQFETAREIGVSAVPAYVADRYLMVGAQPYQVFKQRIDTAQRDVSATGASPA